MENRAHEDLALIRQVMEETRREAVDRGRHFLVWGLVTFVGHLLTFLAATGVAVPDPRWTWTGVLALGWAASMLIGWKEQGQERVQTLGRRMLTATWIAAAVSLTLIGVAGIFGRLVGHDALPGLLSVVIAAPILTTAYLTGERWLSAVAAGWWLCGAIMLIAPGVYTLLLMAAMSLLLMAVPGAVLYTRSGGRRPPGIISDTA